MKYLFFLLSLCGLLLMAFRQKTPADSSSSVPAGGAMDESGIEKRIPAPLTGIGPKILEILELADGYSFRFEFTSEILDELAVLAKNEQLGGYFLTVNILIPGDKRTVWLDLTGPQGTKEFIQTALNLRKTGT